MPAVINELIDKSDNFEIIGQQIAAILKLEIANQVALATGTPGKDPNDWELRVFYERANPWEEFLNNPDVNNRAPIVNVWFDNSNYDPSASNISERQKCNGIYNLDIYGYGVSKDDGAGGHTPGDKEAGLEAHRAIRLVRNILMAAQYTYLGLRGLVWRRWPQSVTVFQPQIEGQAVQNIRGARLAFEVGFNELAPQVQGEPLELVAIEVERSETGEILLLADYDYTQP